MCTVRQRGCCFVLSGGTDGQVSRSCHYHSTHRNCLNDDDDDDDDDTVGCFLNDDDDDDHYRRSGFGGCTLLFLQRAAALHHEPHCHMPVLAPLHKGRGSAGTASSLRSYMESAGACGCLDASGNVNYFGIC